MQLGLGGSWKFLPLPCPETLTLWLSGFYPLPAELALPVPGMVSRELLHASHLQRELTLVLESL